nr:uncharacterized protein LOC121131933 [Lepeophtheirus salmonis]
MITDDWIGLFSHDRIGNETSQKNALASYTITNKQTDNRGRFETNVSLPYESLKNLSSDEHRCFNFWIAYVRKTKIIRVNCLKTRPQWMYTLRSHIGNIPFHQLMIPGTHNSGAIKEFEGYYADFFTKRFSVAQEESIWTQLVMGIRYLDIQIHFTPNGPLIWNNLLDFSPIEDLGCQEVSRLHKRSCFYRFSKFHERNY